MSDERRYLLENPFDAREGHDLRGTGRTPSCSSLRVGDMGADLGIDIPEGEWE